MRFWVDFQPHGLCVVSLIALAIFQPSYQMVTDTKDWNCPLGSTLGPLDSRSPSDLACSLPDHYPLPAKRSNHCRPLICPQDITHILHVSIKDTFDVSPLRWVVGVINKMYLCTLHLTPD